MRSWSTIIVTPESRYLVDTTVYPGDHSIDTEAICEYLESVVNELKLDSKLLFGVTRDNASYMVKGVRMLQRDDDYSHIISVGCLSHGINLVI